MIPLKITCRNIPLSGSIRAEVESFMDKLERFYGRVQRCEVSISAPHRHQRKGRDYHVSVRLSIPGPDLVVSRKAGEDPGCGALHLALSQAFQVLERRLEERVRKMRGFVKSHGAGGREFAA